MTRLKAFFCIIAAATSALVAERQAFADLGNLGEFYHGVRSSAMGGTSAALSDDADAVFYNPAGMALQKRYEVRLFNPKFDVSTDDITTIADIKGAASALDAPTITKLFGKHIYGDMTLFPALVFPNLTIGYYEHFGTEIISRNTSFPTIDASYVHDHGFIGGFAFESRGLSKRHFLRFGVTGKWLTRQGFEQQIPLTSLITADKTYLSKLDSASATGVGLGAGVQYELPVNRANDLILGASWQDIGDTQFGNALQENRPPSIRNNLAMGAALVHRFNTSFRSENNIKFTAEMRHLAETGMDPRLKAHVGLELAVGPVSVQGGLNQDSLTAGIKAEILFLELSAVTYGVEDQALAFMDRERRYMFQLTIKFDIMGKNSATARDLDRRKHPRDY